MKKQDEIKYRLKDVMWAYRNRNKTKIKLLSNGQIIDIEMNNSIAKQIPGIKEPLLRDRVKDALSYNMGYEPEDIGFKYTQGVIERCHANKAKKSKIMCKFELQKKSSSYVFGLYYCCKC